MRDVACDTCNGTGQAVAGPQYSDTWGTHTPTRPCPESHVVLDNDGDPFYADPEKVMWWCAIDKSVHTAASDEPYWCSRWEPDLNPDHAGCGYVARPVVTWKEVTEWLIWSVPSKRRR